MASLDLWLAAGDLKPYLASPAPGCCVSDFQRLGFMRDSDNFSQELQSVFWDRVLRKNPLQKKCFVSPFRPRGGTEKVQAPPQLLWGGVVGTVYVVEILVSQPEGAPRDLHRETCVAPRPRLKLGVAGLVPASQTKLPPGTEEERCHRNPATSQTRWYSTSMGSTKLGGI